MRYCFINSAFKCICCTGKSSITASLAVLLSEDKNIVCADCDVDASNLALVLGANKSEEWTDLSTNEKAVFDLEKCDSCKKCVDACYFNAIDWKNNKPKLKKFSCEGCNVCVMICPQNAISLKNINNAKIGYAKTKYGFNVAFAQLGIGQSGSGKVVSEVKKKAKQISSDADILLIDSAAGIGCPVISSVTGSDYAILVTEPTPSGFSDMKKAFKTVSHFKIPTGIIINKFDLNDKYTNKIEVFAKENKLTIITKIKFDKQFAKALTKMTPIVKFDEKYNPLFSNLKKLILKEIM